MSWFPSSIVRLTAVTLLASLASACGGTTGAAPSSTGVLNETPVAASSSFCITPSTSAQMVTIPTTGGFSGTLAVGAAATNATSCDVQVAITTGADVNASAPQSGVRQTRAASPSTTPILQMSFDSAFPNNVQITGAVLNTPSNLNFPDGTYYATVNSGTQPGTVLQFTAANGVLTLQSTGTPIIIFPGTTTTLSLYARGVVPVETAAPTATPSAGASSTPTPQPSSSASAAPTATPTAAPTAVPTAPATITAAVTLSPAGCTYFGYGGGSQVYTAIVASNAPPGTTFMYGWSSNFPYTIPAPSSQQYDSAIDQDVLVGSQTTATVTIGAQAQGNGTGGSIGVFLFRVDPTYGNLDPVAPVAGTGVQGGAQAGAYATIETGADTCSI